MMIRRSVRRSILGFAAAWALTAAPVAASSAHPAATAPAPRPALWLLADEDTRIYLFGTIHVLPTDLKWRSPRLDEVIEEVDELVVEVTEQDLQDSLSNLQQQVMLGKQVPLVQHLPWLMR